MKVSVVVPVYNVEKYICQCVDSILQQTLDSFEVIIVDDGSTDSSGTILDTYRSKDNRVSVIHKKNEGVSIARNTALKNCSGDYIYIMDSDDYLEPNALEIMYDEAIRTGADVVVADHFKFIDDANQQEFHYFSKGFVTEEKETILQIQKMVFHKGYSPFPSSSNKGMGIGAPWTKLLKRDLILQNNLQFDPYVHGVFDDCLFSLGVFEFAKKVSYLPKAIYHFRVLQSSLTHRFRQNQLEIYGKIFERIQNFGEKHKKGPDYMMAYYARVITYLSLSFDTYFFNVGYKGGKKNNYKEFLNTFRSSPYHEAIQKVDYTILDNREKRIVRFSRLGLTGILWLLYAYKNSR